MGKFLQSYGSFYGVYSTFKEASKIIKNKNIGYNNKQTLERFKESHKLLMEGIRETEYPIFMWLNKILEDNKDLSILDFGGAFGFHYFKFKKLSSHLDYKWNIIDVPEVVDYANTIYSTNNLSFFKSINDIEKVDVFIASGSVQYVENFSITNLKNKPKYLIFARLPLNDKTKTIITLQNAISSFKPQYVYNKNEFIDNILSLGYELIDEWKSHYDKCIIPNHKDESCPYYSGLYFKLK